ncbi:unnamed protein product [Cuscuta epithymum]|uniref:PPM-type phosphatase domain-containing protein n=1 Tax=Cuscuta epithymum TaxID=186058 RepID=A0AAV0D8K0_9ASTE|nr:unnamed protein product [Cuscuta epithymum]
MNTPCSQTASRVAAPSSQSRTSSQSHVVSHSSSQKSSQSASSFISPTSQVSSESLAASHSSSTLAVSHTSRASPLSLGSVKLRQPSSNDRSASQFREKADKFTEGENELEEPVSVIVGPEAGAIAGPETFSKYEFVKPDRETNRSAMVYHHSSNINWEGLNKFNSLSCDQAVGMGQAFYLCSGDMKPPKFAVKDGTLAYIDPGMMIECNKINHCEEIIAAADRISESVDREELTKSIVKIDAETDFVVLIGDAFWWPVSMQGVIICQNFSLLKLGGNRYITRKGR